MQEIETTIENLLSRIGERNYYTEVALDIRVIRQLWEERKADKEKLEVAKEALLHYKYIETLSNLRGDCPIINEATKALEFLEGKEKQDVNT